MTSANLQRLNKNFSFDLTLTAGGDSLKDFEKDTETDDYRPFRNVTVINDGSTNVKVFINDEEQGRKVPAGTIKEFNGLVCRRVLTKNLDGSNANNDVTLEVNNDVTQFDLLNFIAQRLTQ